MFKTFVSLHSGHASQFLIKIEHLIHHVKRETKKNKARNVLHKVTPLLLRKIRKYFIF